MQGNTISNINFSTTIGTTTAAGIFSGISVLAGTVLVPQPETPLVPQPEMMLFRFHLPLP
jgi:hypothetical protein